MKIGIADYGMNVWDGGNCFDMEERLTQLKQIGYEGIERLTVANGEHAIQSASRMKRLGMDFTTVRAATPELSIQYTAAFGKSYVWTHVDGRSLDVFCRQVQIQAAACERWGINVALHNHMGTPVETQDQLEQYLEACPTSKLVFDTAHLAAMGGNPVEIVTRYTDRLAVIHLKDWLEIDPSSPDWTKRVRFCGLGKGKIGQGNAAVLEAAVRGGFDGWVFVEHDIHLQEPLVDLTMSRQYIREVGY